MGSTYSAATDGVWSSDLNDFMTANAVNWLDNTSNNLYLTGVQLEVGEKATPFEHRSYGDELQRCQDIFANQNGHSAISYQDLVIGLFLQGLRL